MRRPCIGVCARGIDSKRWFGPGALISQPTLAALLCLSLSCPTVQVSSSGSSSACASASSRPAVRLTCAPANIFDQWAARGERLRVLQVIFCCAAVSLTPLILLHRRFAPIPQREALRKELDARVERLAALAPGTPKTTSLFSLGKMRVRLLPEREISSFLLSLVVLHRAPSEAALLLPNAGSRRRTSISSSASSQPSSAARSSASTSTSMAAWRLGSSAGPTPCSTTADRTRMRRSTPRRQRSLRSARRLSRAPSLSHHSAATFFPLNAAPSRPRRSLFSPVSPELRFHMMFGEAEPGRKPKFWLLLVFVSEWKRLGHPRLVGTELSEVMNKMLKALVRLTNGHANTARAPALASSSLPPPQPPTRWFFFPPPPPPPPRRSRLLFRRHLTSSPSHSLRQVQQLLKNEVGANLIDMIDHLSDCPKETATGPVHARQANGDGCEYRAASAPNPPTPAPLHAQRALCSTMHHRRRYLQRLSS